MNSKLSLLTALILLALVFILCPVVHGPAILAALKQPGSGNIATPSGNLPTSAKPGSFKLVWGEDNKPRLMGTLPDQATRKNIIDAATGEYGEGGFVDELKVDPTALSVDWMTRADKFLPPANYIMEGGGLEMKGEKIVLTGTVVSEEIRKKIFDSVKSGAGTTEVEDQMIVEGGETPPIIVEKTEPAPQPTPQAKQELQKELNEQILGKTIEFATNSDLVSQSGQRILQQVARVLKASPNIVVEVGGHTDNRANKAYNLNLSSKRAVAVKRYLISQGIASGRLTTKGYGDTLPIATNSTEQGRQLNRRIGFKVIR